MALPARIASSDNLRISRAQCAAYGSLCGVVARCPDVGQAGGSERLSRRGRRGGMDRSIGRKAENKNSACIMVVVGYMVVVRNGHMSEMRSEERPKDTESGEVLPVLVPVAWDRSNREGEV